MTYDQWKTATPPEHEGPEEEDRPMAETTTYKLAMLELADDFALQSHEGLQDLTRATIDAHNHKGFESDADRVDSVIRRLRDAREHFQTQIALINRTIDYLEDSGTPAATEPRF